MGAARWDVFVSYARTDARAAAALVEALRTTGLRVFIDDRAIADFTGISDTIRRELSDSRVLLCVYSRGYPLRRACQWELTSAFLAGQREGDPRSRVLVVNPETDTAHIHPVELRDVRHLPGPGSGRDWADAARRIAAHVRQVRGGLGDIAAAPAPLWSPGPPGTGSPRFTGRIRELWALHSALHSASAPLVTGHAGGRWAVVRGPAGIGKTLLAQEYALRFAPAYPGGIFWFSLAPAGSSARLAWAGLEQRYADDLAVVAGESGTPAVLLQALAQRLAAKGKPFLWVVDGVPDGLDSARAGMLRAPHPLGSTVFTSRSRGYAASAAEIAVGPLGREEAVELLCAGAGGVSADPAAPAAARLAADTGGHPLALDLLGNDPQGRGPAPQSQLLHTPARDLLSELAAGVLTPTGYPADVPRSLLADSGSGTEVDVLRIVAACDPQPVNNQVVADVLASADGLTPAAALARTISASSSLHRLSLIDLDDGQGMCAPALAAWVLRRGDPDPERGEQLRKATLSVLGRRPATTLEGEIPQPGAAPEALMPHTTPAPPTEDGRRAAYEIQSELALRVGIQRLGSGAGILREALTSLHHILVFCREVLRRYNIALAAPHDARDSSVEAVVDELVNQVLRPFLERWHPRLSHHESARPDGVGSVAHEQVWDQAAQLRAELDALHEPLVRIAGELGQISGSDLGFARRPERQ